MYNNKKVSKWIKVFKWLTPIAFINAIAPAIVASNIDQSCLQTNNPNLNSVSNRQTPAKEIESVHIEANESSLVYQEGSWITIKSIVTWKNNNIGNINVYNWWSYGTDKTDTQFYVEQKSSPYLSLKATPSLNGRTFQLNILYGDGGTEFVATSKEELKITVLPQPISELTYIMIFVSFSILIILCLILVDIRFLYRRDN